MNLRGAPTTSPTAMSRARADGGSATGSSLGAVLGEAHDDVGARPPPSPGAIVDVTAASLSARGTRFEMPQRIS
jgi:hypothetical protein